MARSFRGLIIAGVLFPGALAWPQNDPPPAATPSPSASSGPKQAGDGKKPDEFEDARRVFEKLRPEERQRFRENFQRWKNMPPDEKEAMRAREQFRREKIAQEIDESLHKAGLQLDPDRREVFALRYAQERRKIEDRLRKEMEEKRRPATQEMLNRLKAEFSLPAASPGPSPSPSPKP